MNDLPENELLSAYLDGELTAPEQAEVERLLARNPAARQLVDELRALSSTLQALPQHTLSEDLGDRVLRTAERRILAGPPVSTEAEPLPQPVEPAATPEPVAPLGRTLGGTIIRRLIASRALAWSALAVSVAILLTLAQRDWPNDAAPKKLARTPESEVARPRDLRIGAAPSDEWTGDDGKWADDRAASTTFEKGEGALKQGGDAAAESPRNPKDSGQSDVAAGRQPALVQGVAPSALPDTSQQARDNRRETVEAIEKGKVAMPGEEPMPAKGAVAPPSGTPSRDDAGTVPVDDTPDASDRTDPSNAAIGGRSAAGRGGRGGGMGGMGGGMGGMAGGMGGARGAIGGRAAPRVASSPPESQSTVQHQIAEGMADGAAGTAAGVGIPKPAAPEVAAKIAAQPTDGYAVVCCDLSPSAFFARDFDQVLLANGITVVQTVPDEAVSYYEESGLRSRIDEAGHLQEEPSGQPSEPLPVQQQSPEARRQIQELLEQQKLQEKEREGTVDQLARSLSQGGELDLVCVEATTAQIEATLAALGKRPGEVFSIAVKPAVGAEAQKNWSEKYGRGLQNENRQSGATQTLRGGSLATDATENVQANVAAPTPEEGIATEEGDRSGYAWRLAMPQSQSGRMSDSEVTAQFGTAPSAMAGQQSAPTAVIAPTPPGAAPMAPPDQVSAGATAPQQDAAASGQATSQPVMEGRLGGASQNAGVSLNQSRAADEQQGAAVQSFAAQDANVTTPQSAPESPAFDQQALREKVATCRVLFVLRPVGPEASVTANEPPSAPTATERAIPAAAPAGRGAAGAAGAASH